MISGETEPVSGAPPGAAPSDEFGVQPLSFGAGALWPTTSKADPTLVKHEPEKRAVARSITSR